MKLIKTKLRNFRCYQRETEFIIDDLTAIIGKNDIGKSAILEAIDGFFNDTVDQSDLSNTADSNAIEITCYFEGIPDEIVLDTSEPSSPISEGILNPEGQLQIKKVFTFGAKKTTAVFLIANHLSDERLKILLSKKNTSLKQYAKDLGVDLSDVNQKKNSHIREAIRRHIGGDIAVQELKVDGNVDNEDNLKAVWSSLKKLLPVFSLFKTDKAFDDKDSDIKDPLQSAINEALGLPEIQDLLSEIENKVREFSTDIADRTIEKLKNFDETISERLKSDFTKNPNYSKIFDLTLLNENNIPLNKRGSGIRRLVVLSFFQAQAEKRKADKNAPSIIYAIEEPETSQHPNHQKMIIDALSELSRQPNVQVLFTTHSANLVREIPIHSLRYVSPDDDGIIQIEYGEDLESEENNDEVISKIVSALGILPNPSERIKVLVYVEGNHDVNALKRYSKIINDNDASLLNLMTSHEVGYVITGGSALKHYIEQRHLDGLGKPEVHIYDNDVDDYRAAVQRINNLTNPNKIAFNTKKLELESYLHPEAIREAYSECGTEGVSLQEIEDNTDVPHEVARLLNSLNDNNWGELDSDKQKELASNKKKFLNVQAVEKMTVERIKERGGYEEICHWLTEITRLSTK